MYGLYNCSQLGVCCSLSTPLFSALCFGEHNCTQAGCFILFICLVNVPVVFCGNAEHFIVCNSRKWNVLKEIEMWNLATFCEQKAFLSIVGLKRCWFAQEKSWLVFVVMNKKVGWAFLLPKNFFWSTVVSFYMAVSFFHPLSHSEELGVRGNELKAQERNRWVWIYTEPQNRE